ncbi:hypothetical protein AAG906_025887 [Vitis piasezkii]
MVIDWDSPAEHVMTSWTLEMDYANNISSIKAIEALRQTSGASKGKVSIKEARPKALGEPLVKSRSEIIPSVYKGILPARVKIFNESEKDLEVLMED